MNDPAARLTRAGTDIHDPVGSLHRLLVVLDDDERVAQVAQALERRDELAVVALVQADRRLIQNVEDTDEAGADLRGQADTLCLASRQCARTARERQVGQAHVNEEGQAGLDLGEDGCRDSARTLLEFDGREELTCLQDGHVGQLGDRLVADTHCQDLRLQARALARRARNLTHVGVELLGHSRRLGLLALTLNVVDRALEARRVRALAAPAVAELDGDLVVLAIQNGVFDLLGQVLPGRAHREAEFLGQGFEELLVVLEVRVPGDDSTVGEREFLVGDDQLGVHLLAEAKSRAVRARAVGGVEGEGARLDLVEGQRVVIRAGALLGETAAALRVVLVQVDAIDDDEAIGQAQRGLDRIGEALAHALADDKAVDNDLDRVFEFLLQLGGILETHGLAVDDRARVALGAQFVDEILVLALAAAHDRGKDLEARALVHRAHAVDDLLGCLCLDARPALGAVRDAGTRVEQTQVVVDLRDRADRRARVA